MKTIQLILLSSWVAFGKEKYKKQTRISKKFSIFPATSQTSCPSGNGYFANPSQCDAYTECKDGIGEAVLCPEGLVFNDKLQEYPRYPYVLQHLMFLCSYVQHLMFLCSYVQQDVLIRKKLIVGVGVKDVSYLFLSCFWVKAMAMFCLDDD